MNLRVHAQPVITTQPVNQPVVWGSNATFSVTATDIGPLTYQWQLNGTNLPNNIITTVVGGQLFNNLQATNTIFNNAANVALDSAGNMFIADYGNHIIRKVATNGVTTIVAGNGSCSYSGDGGAATNAGLNFPNVVVVDSIGDLFISDNGNLRIRKVNTNGIITTVAGNGAYGSSGDGGAATNASFSYPAGLCCPSIGYLLIADRLTSSVRMVQPNGIITTLINSLFANPLSNPNNLAMDSSNNLFIADSSNNKIRKWNNISLTTIAGTGTSGFSGDGGLATNAKLKNPQGVAVDAVHNLYIADSGNYRVRKVDTNNIITTVAGDGTNGFSGDGGLATNASLSGSLNISVDSIGNLFIADSVNNRIRKVGTNGIIATVAGRNLNDGDFAANATLNTPHGIAIDCIGNLYIADAYNNRIRKVDTNGIITTVVGSGIYTWSGDGGAATNASMQNPFGVSLGSAGNLLIADTFNSCIRKVDTNGIISTLAGKGNSFPGDGGAATNAELLQPYGVAGDAIGNCFIADTLVNRVRKVDTNGVITTMVNVNGFYPFGGGFSGEGAAATSAALNYPSSVALDSVGNLFIADTHNLRIREVNTNGIINTVAGNGAYGYSGDGGISTNASFSAPVAVTVDSAGNIYIADLNNQRIRKVSTNGIIATIAGNGIQGFSGDAGSGNNASLSLPNGVIADGKGNIYFSDTGNNRIRKLAFVDYADQPSFTLTNVTAGTLTNNYSVIITSADGSVTSSVVAVNLYLPPITPAFTSSNGTFSFTWNAVSNLTYQLQYNLDLTTTNWINLGSPITATNSSISTGDVISSDTQRFYRVLLVQ